MASSLFHKLLKDHQTSFKLIISLNKSKQTQFPIPSLVPHHLRDPPILPPNSYNPNFTPFQTSDVIYSKAVPIFPSFPFGYCLNPVSATGSALDYGEDGGMMWADSVKKKRKKKMNKHKLKKLRKRLRRKT